MAELGQWAHRPIGFVSKLHLRQENRVLGHPEVPRDKVLPWDPSSQQCLDNRWEPVVGSEGAEAPTTSLQKLLAWLQGQGILSLQGSSGGHPLCARPSEVSPSYEPRPIGVLGLGRLPRALIF